MLSRADDPEHKPIATAVMDVSSCSRQDESNSSANATANRSGDLDAAVPERQQARAANWTAIAALAMLVTGVFWRTIFLCRPISRLCYITNWDSALSAYSGGLSKSVDPSAVLLAFPCYSLIARQMHAGQLPLWNPLNGCGSPLWADLQTAILSPIHWLYFACPTQYAYNLQIVLAVLLSAIGSYLLARECCGKPLVALFAGAAFGICPFMLWYLELQSGQSFVFYPLCMWLFVRAARNLTTPRSLVAGIGAGFVILSGHPECAVFCIFASVFLSALLIFFHSTRKTIRAKCAAVCGLLILSGLTAFCISAPATLPFVEFLLNGDCYKYGVTQSASIPLLAVGLNLLTPGASGASPYLGPLVLPLLPFALLSDSRRRKFAWALAATACLSVAIAAKAGPFECLLARPPFSYLLTVYWVPIYLLSILALSAIGLEWIAECIKGAQSWSRVAVISSVSLVLVGIGVPCWLLLSHAPLPWADFDMTLPHSAVDKMSVLRDSVILLLSAVIVLACAKKKSRRVCILSLVVLNFIGVASIAKTSLPAQAPFEIPGVKLFEKLVCSTSRSVSTGTHVANPNINTIYGFSDLRSRNAMWPRGYMDFVRAVGGQANNYVQVFPSQLPASLDLSATRYVVSAEPISCTSDASAIRRQGVPMLSGTVSLLPWLRTTYSDLYNDRGNRQLNGKLRFDTDGAPPPESIDLAYVLELHDGRGNVIWFSDRQPLKINCSLPMSIAIPAVGKSVDTASGLGIDRAGCAVYISLFDQRAQRFIDIGASGASDKALRLTAIPQAAECAHHFRLAENFSGNLRLYENSGSLPEAYLVSEILPVPKSRVLDTLQSPKFDCHKMAIIEDNDIPGDYPSVAKPGEGGEQLPVNGRSPARDTLVPCKLLRLSANDVRITCPVAARSLLVLTDTFYPGWNAYVDGARRPVLRVNGFFRGVRVDPGNHTVIFRFEPVSLLAGLFCFCLFGLAMLAYSLRLLRRPK